MKKVLFISLAILAIGGIWFYFISDHEIQSVLAQKDEAEAARKQDENDKNIPQEQVDQAYLEARTIKEAVIQAFAKLKPHYQLARNKKTIKNKFKLIT